jgi:outer membrane protein OmpA-like peptidoglycan-associated protein
MLKPSAALIFLVVVSAAGAATPARAETVAPAVAVRETVARGEAVEMHLPVEQTFTPWIHDYAAFAAAQGDRLEMRQVLEPDVKTIKLENVVPPIHFRLGEAEIPEDYLLQLREVLNSMRDRSNVRLHFVGHSDSLRLSPALQERYGDNTGLSRERAGTTAEYFQNALGLPPEAISYEGFGESQPVASNADDAGRQLNRRVEVQVWYDEISEKLVDKEVVVASEINRL